MKKLSKLHFLLSFIYANIYIFLCLQCFIVFIGRVTVIESLSIDETVITNGCFIVNILTAADNFCIAYCVPCPIVSPDIP